MHKYLPEERGKKRELAYRDTKSGIFIEQDYSRQGGAQTITFRCVCEVCNTGWMNTLEQQAKEILIPLIEGRNVTILGKGLKTLIEWVTLKVLVGENADRNMGTTSSADLLAFKEDRSIPPSLRIWIGTYGNRDYFRTEHLYKAVAIHPDKIRMEPPPNVYSMITTFGYFVVHVRSSVYDRLNVHRVFKRIESVELLTPRFDDPEKKILKWPPAQARIPGAPSALVDDFCNWTNAHGKRV